MRKILLLVNIVLGLALALSACGPDSTTLNVTTTEAGYDSPTYTVPAGATVKLTLTNNGILPHEFAILKLGEQVTLPFSDDDEAKILWELDEVEPGQAKSDTFTAPTVPGEYSVVCGIPGHIELGMVATLIVK